MASSKVEQTLQDLKTEISDPANYNIVSGCMSARSGVSFDVNVRVPPPPPLPNLSNNRTDIVLRKFDLFRPQYDEIVALSPKQKHTSGDGDVVANVCEIPIYNVDNKCMEEIVKRIVKSHTPKIVNDCKIVLDKLVCRKDGEKFKIFKDLDIFNNNKRREDDGDAAAAALLFKIVLFLPNEFRGDEMALSKSAFMFDSKIEKFQYLMFSPDMIQRMALATDSCKIGVMANIYTNNNPLRYDTEHIKIFPNDITQTTMRERGVERSVDDIIMELKMENVLLSVHPVYFQYLCSLFTRNGYPFKVGFVYRMYGVKPFKVGDYFFDCNNNWDVEELDYGDETSNRGIHALDAYHDLLNHTCIGIHRIQYIIDTDDYIKTHKFATPGCGCEAKDRFKTFYAILLNPGTREPFHKFNLEYDNLEKDIRYAITGAMEIDHQDAPKDDSVVDEEEISEELPTADQEEDSEELTADEEEDSEDSMVEEETKKSLVSDPNYVPTYISSDDDSDY